ncbi:hypothetical protein LCGC14_1474710 [marine sediment metagenome]|uniref:Uncharacterized protein n=1 Tax=marine sediment metagenome TaxID=412755 RepID=A0A0F9LRT2_9ZZZZ
MRKKLEKLIKKLNSMEGNMLRPERNFYLGRKMWFVGRTSLKVNGVIANYEEQKEFLKLKNEFDNYG